MRLILLESPFAGNRSRNVAYAKACLRHALSLGDAPLASHLLYPQILQDEVPEDRALGIAAGLAWGRVAELQAFYIDFGWSPGMARARSLGQSINLPQAIRTLPEAFWTPGLQAFTRRGPGA